MLTMPRCSHGVHSPGMTSDRRCMTPDVAGGMAHPSIGSINPLRYFFAWLCQVGYPIKIWLLAFRKIGWTARPINFLQVNIALVVARPGSYLKGIPHALQVSR